MSAVGRNGLLDPKANERTGGYYDILRANAKVPIINGDDFFTKTEDQRFNEAADKFERDTPQYLKDTLSESNPLPWQQYLDRDTANLGANIETRAKSGYNEEKPLMGLGDTEGVLTDQSPMGKAIGARFAREYGNKIEDIKNANSISSKVKSQRDLSRASDVFAKQHQIRIQNYKEQMDYQKERMRMYDEWKAAQDKAQSDFLSSVLGFIPGIGGIALGLAKGGGSSAKAGTTG